MDAATGVEAVEQTAVHWSVYGGWVLAAVGFVVGGFMLYIIKPIRDQVVRTSEQLVALEEKNVRRLQDLDGKYHQHMRNMEDRSAGQIKALELKQVEYETTIRIYTENQASMQRMLGRIEQRMTEASTSAAAQAEILKFVSTQMEELRKIHMQETKTS